MARKKESRDSGGDLDRKLGGRKPKTTLWLFIEGQNTERGWTRHLTSLDRTLNLKLECSKGGQVPTTLVQAASDKRVALKRAGKRADSARDEVWVVFDRDHHHDVEGCLDRCRHHGIGVVFSNACFELWPLLHLESVTASQDARWLQARLHELHPPYEHDRGAYVTWAMLGSSAVAIDRAVHLHRRAFEGGSAIANPTTTAWLLHLRCAHAAAVDEIVAVFASKAHLDGLVSLLAEPVRSEVQQGRAALTAPHPPT
jgi:hypothetical protein